MASNSYNRKHESGYESTSGGCLRIVLFVIAIGIVFGVLFTVAQAAGV